MKIQKNGVAVDFEALIKKAVNEAFQAGRKSAAKERSPYQMTESRLYALPALVKKVNLDNEELERLKEGGKLPERSKDLTRFTKYGSRISAEDQIDAVIINIEASIAKDEHEIKTVRLALESLEDEYYYPTIAAKYFNKKSDGEMAKEMHCEDRTIRRQRSRLVKEISVLLYGSDAI